MAKKHISLQHSESVVVQAAAQIYSAYVSSGRVKEGEETEWMKKSAQEAITIAQLVDDAIISDGEVEADPRQDLGASARRST